MDFFRLQTRADSGPFGKGTVDFKGEGGRKRGLAVEWRWPRWES